MQSSKNLLLCLRRNFVNSRAGYHSRWETLNLPSLPNYLPRQSLVKNTAKYVVGPLAMDKLRSPLPSQLVDFNAGAEVVIGKYASSAGDATLMLISYPTPQIAGEHLRQIDAFHSPSTQQQAGAATLVDI